MENKKNTSADGVAVGNDKLTVWGKREKSRMNNQWKESQQIRIFAFNRETKRRDQEEQVPECEVN